MMWCVVDSRVKCVGSSYPPKLDELKLCNVSRCPVKELVKDNKRLRGEVKMLGESK